jgi:hypothetical protein
LAKGALFLLVGVMMGASGRGRRLLCLAIAAAISASVAGLPLTGGALAKAAVKQGLADWAALALSLSSTATSLILVWFLSRLWRTQGREEAAWGGQLALPAALGVLAIAGPWLFWSVWSGEGPDYLLKPGTLIDALWPVAIALPPAAIVLRWRLPQRPPSDLLLLLGAWRGRTVKMPSPLSLRADVGGACRAARRNSARLEGLLIRWRLTGVLVPLLVLLMLTLLS